MPQYASQAHQGGLRRIYHCPYCPSQQGHIAIATSAFVQAAREGLPPLGLRLNEPNDFIICNPDHADNRVCPHLISGYIDCDIRAPVVGDSAESVFTLSCNWDHPWFTEHPSGDHADAYLWDNIELDGPFVGGTPHLCARVQRRWPLGEGQELTGLAWLLAALEPQRFLADLVEAEQRS